MLRTKTGEARSKFDWIETVGREDAEDGLLIGTRFSQRSHEYRVTRVVRVARALWKNSDGRKGGVERDGRTTAVGDAISGGEKSRALRGCYVDGRIGEISAAFLISVLPWLKGNARSSARLASRSLLARAHA